MRIAALVLIVAAGGPVATVVAQSGGNPPSTGSPCTVSVTVPPAPGRGGGPAPGAGGRGGGVPPAPAGEPPRLLELTANLYVVQNANHTLADLGIYGGNSVVFVTPDGVILIDSKSEREHDDLVAKVRSLTDKPIRYVVLTHNHGDHTGGAPRLQQDGAAVVLSAGDASLLAATSPIAQTHIEFSNRGTLMLGGSVVRLMEFCGHTRGDTVAYFPSARAIAVGDLIAWPNTIPPQVNYADGGNWTDALRTLNTVGTLDWDILIPGHGPPMTRQDFTHFVSQMSAAIDTVKALIRRGGSQDDVAQLLERELAAGIAPSPRTAAGMMIEFR